MSADRLPEIWSCPNCALHNEGPDLDADLYDEAVKEADDNTVPLQCDSDVPAPEGILATCLSLIAAFQNSDAQLHVFPSWITAKIRGDIHRAAECAGLHSRSHLDESDGRCVVISKLPFEEQEILRELVQKQRDVSKTGRAAKYCNWRRRRLKTDPRHWMANFLLMAHSKQSPIYPFFAAAVSNAVYKYQVGELDRLREHLRAREMPEESIENIPRRYKRCMCRLHIPAPHILERDLTEVYVFFSNLTDPSTTMSFFVYDSHKRFATMMWYVYEGYLSDPPNINLYV